MHVLLAAITLVAQSAAPPAAAVPAPLTLEQQSALRCSVAVAMGADQQRAGLAGGKKWPDLTTRGREFFVRSLARLMDDAKLTRPMLAAHVQRETAQLKQPGRLDEVMPACLLLLDAAGL